MNKLNVWNEDMREMIARPLNTEAETWHALHRPPLGLEAWKRKREALKRTIRKKAGSFPPAPELEMKVHGAIERKGYRIEKITFQSRPGLRVTANLYVPDGAGPFPAVLNVHGHWNEGKIPARVQMRGQVLVQNGFVVLAVDAFGSGERCTTPGQYEYHGAGIGSSLFQIGESLLGMQIYDNMRALDLLCSLPYVDKKRLGVTGASGGGNQTMWLSAMDDRVKAACPVVSVGTFASYVLSSNCICEVIPDGLTFMEEWALLGLIAPNPLLILNSLQDSRCFSVQEMIRSFNDAREIYRLYGAGDKIMYQAIDLPHGYWPEMLSAMLGWFKRWLKDEGDGRPCALPECIPLPEKKCLCFPDLKRPPAVSSIVEYALPRAKKLCADHIRGKARINRTKKSSELKAILRFRAPAGLPASEVHSGKCKGVQLRKFVLQSEPGIFLPGVLVSSSSGKIADISIVIHREGKERAAEEPAIAEKLKKHDAVLFVDLRNTGETWYEEKKGQQLSWPFHYYYRSAFWLGRTLIGDWAADILTAVNFCADNFPKARIGLYAFDELGIPALCASAFTKRINTLVTARTPCSYCAGDKVTLHSLAITIPGILKWGNISMMAALSSAQVKFVSPALSNGEKLSEKELQAQQKEFDLIAARCGCKSKTIFI